MDTTSENAPLSFRKVLRLAGPNVWANFPVLEAWVDLAELKDTSSEMIPGFNERLMGWLPTMIEHRCSVGERGGFFQRLRRGTYMAHILEHVTLELQSLAGHDVGFGRAREMDEEGVYRVAIEYVHDQVAKAALDAGRRLVLAAVYDQPFDVGAEVARLRDLAHEVCLGPSTQAIVDAAKARGIPAIRLNEGSLVQLGYGAAQRRIWTAETDQTSAIGEAIAKDKELTRGLLMAAGIPVPAGRPVQCAGDAWEAAREIGLPVVVKPQHGNQGRGVAVNLQTEAEVRAAYEAARKEESTVVVERHISGNDYRLLVVGKRVVAAARRDPAQVTGDGRSSIVELIEQANRDPRRSDGHATVMSLIKIDEVARAVLKQQGYQPDSVPPAGQTVLIRRNANLSTGGSAVDVTDCVHPDVAARAVEAARMVGLDIAGIDVVAADIAMPLENQGAAIVEVNAGPGLRMHLQPSVGTPRPVGEAIVDGLFGGNSNGRIPVVAVTGVNGKTTTTRLIAHILALQGKKVGMTATDGVFVSGRQIDVGDCSGPRSARRLLMNPALDAAVLETARGGILREGLAFDRCDIAVVTNIGEGDHLGVGPIQTLEQLAKVKRTIIDVVVPEGCGVLNADDPLVVEMAAHCPGSIAWFSQRHDHPRLAESRAAGGRVVFVRDGALVLSQGSFEFTLLALERIPMTLGGRIRFQIENAMAAAAATWALGVPAEVIRAGLESFLPSLDSCPARFNLIEWRGATLIIDYGHNPSALQGVIDSLPNFPHQRRLAVYSTAGDRRDCDMVRQGEQLGEGFDIVCLYEGDYVRGREKGDITRLIEEGVKRGTRAKEIHSFASWNAATDYILAHATAGDVVLVQADSVEESLPYLRERLIALASAPR